MTTPTTSPKRGEFDVEANRRVAHEQVDGPHGFKMGTLLMRKGVALDNACDEIDRLNAIADAAIKNQEIERGISDRLRAELASENTALDRLSRQYVIERDQARSERDALAKRIEGLRAALKSVSESLVAMPIANAALAADDRLATSDGGGEG